MSSLILMGPPFENKSPEGGRKRGRQEEGKNADVLRSQASAWLEGSLREKSHCKCNVGTGRERREGKAGGRGRRGGKGRGSVGRKPLSSRNQNRSLT